MWDSRTVSLNLELSGMERGEEMIGWDYKKYGKPFSMIDGSLFYRGYCPECGSPVRLDKGRAELKMSIYCIDCSPPHKGCSSPPSPVDEIDEYSSSWKLSTIDNDER